jgi:hypothetical protein
MRRPAEVGGAASALALLLGRAFGIDDVDTVTALAVVIGILPAAITWTVSTVRGSE